MNQFIETNWLSLVSILIGIVVAYVFYRLQKKDAASASQERKKHATNELLDVVESYVINKQALSEDVIENLIFASERDHCVQLRPHCTAISLLQDVALRLQRSRHLDIPQKSEYSLKIEELIQEIRNRVQPALLDRLSIDIQKSISELESIVPDEKRDEARRKLTQLATFSEQRRGIIVKGSSNSDSDIVGPMFAGIVGLIATLFLGNRALTDVASSPLSPIFEKLFTILGGLMGAVILLQVIVIALRIRKRSRQANREVRGDEG